MKFSFAHLMPGFNRGRTQADASGGDAAGEGEDTAGGGDAGGEGEDTAEGGGEGEDTAGGGEGEDTAAGGEDDAEAAASVSVAYARGRADEKARCAAIFAEPAAAGNIAATCELAFNTTLSAKQAAGVLAVTGGKGGGGLRQAMHALTTPKVGSAGPGAGGDRPSGSKANPLVAAHAKATGRLPRPSR
ncbi:hypothetical protein MCW82_09945 [Azospirillum doebereinerae]|uniref:hypothetical protein n=1 Tax=Azospirillum doebereinerae TaxID=92933 RepID=UPI001EE62F45|nr:hypothetical protein [Azospirillum doebereinerae]MCG5240087.1 hypothetical protein [Azospirillum doebereinerae]